MAIIGVADIRAKVEASFADDDDAKLWIPAESYFVSGLKSSCHFAAIQILIQLLLTLININNCTRCSKSKENKSKSSLNSTLSSHAGVGANWKVFHALKDLHKFITRLDVLPVIVTRLIGAPRVGNTFLICGNKKKFSVALQNINHPGLTKSCYNISLAGRRYNYRRVVKDFYPQS